MNPEKPQPRHWLINGLRMEALCWGDPQAHPLLCLHGWLDNAASFSLLGPLLTGFHVVALDLSGHGHSSRRSSDATYQIWDDLPEIVGVADALGWDRFDLMGHSRGGIISTLLASTLPQRVRRVVLLDAIAPQPVLASDFPVQLANFLHDKYRLLNRETRVFRTLEEGVRCRTDVGLPPAAAQLLAERNLVPCENGFTWRTDPRLRGASAVKLTQEHIEAVLGGLVQPTLLLMSQGRIASNSALLNTATRQAQALQVEEIAGGHHFHMEPGVDGIAQRIMQFLQEQKPRGEIS
mgnify:CR=1 FL=1